MKIKGNIIILKTYLSKTNKTKLIVKHEIINSQILLNTKEL